jgi:hypothetical protein
MLKRAPGSRPRIAGQPLLQLGPLSVVSVDQTGNPLLLLYAWLIASRHGWLLIA